MARLCRQSLFALGVLILGAIPAVAQPSPDVLPITLPQSPTTPAADTGKPFVVQPATSGVGQFVVPQNNMVAGSAPLPSAPPAPAITMLVLVPRDASPAQPIPYEIRVTNNSQADAGKVKVRMPLPEGMTYAGAEPKPAGEGPELTWDLHGLVHGETRKIELKLRAGPNVSEITAKAYVSYEFGQTVKTRLSAQKLKVTTELPRLVTSADESILVKVKVANDGKVPVQNVKLTETISDGFEFDRDTAGERTASPLTRTWELGTIAGGMGKQVEYRVNVKAGRELLVRSNIDAAGGLQATDDAKVSVRDAKLKVQLSGDPQAIDDTATFKMTVKNEGTMTLTNVRVVGSVPEEARVTSRTNGGQLYQGQVQWTLPKLLAGESFTYKWVIQSRRPGRKIVRASAESERSVRDSQEVETVFAGVAALTWEPRFEQATVNVDKTGMYTVKVSNTGSDVAKNLRLTLTLPEGISFVQATPKQSVSAGVVTFEPRDLRAGGSEIYSLTFKGERTGPAYITAKLTSDATEKPMASEKYVQVVSGR